MGLLIGAFIFDALGIYPCPMCIVQRWCFAFAGLSALGLSIFKNNYLNRLLTVVLYGFLIFGILFSSRQIFVQNLPIDELMSIGGCGMPFSTMVEYQGLFNALIMAYQGGPSCAEDGWRFIFNFAEWALIAFLGMIFFYMRGRVYPRRCNCSGAAHVYLHCDYGGSRSRSDPLRHSARGRGHRLCR